MGIKDRSRIKADPFEQDRFANLAGPDPGLGLSIGGVKAAHEPDREFFVWILGDGLFNRQAIINRLSQWLFAENMLMGSTSFDCLFLMRIGTGCDNNRIDF